ncbi:MAG: hypothetical protein WCC48_01770 [Anaeromyxobacteraceae bacterium]
MSSCCSGESCDKTNVAWSTRTACPRCGAVGKVVGDDTIRAILKPGHADALRALERRFCGTPSCAVLYYDAEGRVVEKSAASVRIGVKEAEDPIPLCYCFGFTRADVRREVAETGESTIPNRIDAEVRAGRCACERKNPSGACCLGDVRKAAKEAEATLAAGPDASGDTLGHEASNCA